MVDTILIVEDDGAIQQYLKDILMDAGYAVDTADDGIEAIARVKKSQPDVVLLDLGLPKMRGEAVCKEIKKQFPDVQVIILTSQDTTPDIVRGLNIGADDYVTKPFEVDEVLARVQARLRAKNPSDNKLVVDDLVIDTTTMDVKRGKKEIVLTPQEYKLLEYLIRNQGKVLTRNMILNRLWLFSPDIDTRVVDVYIGYLRKKIDADAKKKLIHSIRGFGYSIRG
jgi:DNA-binding response OmpR family regulator